MSSAHQTNHSITTNTSTDSDTWDTAMTESQCQEKLAKNEFNRLEHDHKTAGYRHGITIGRTQTVQNGFDLGYRYGLAAGNRAGQVVGQLRSVLLALKVLNFGPGSELLNDGNTLLQSAYQVFGSIPTTTTNEYQLTTADAERQSFIHQQADTYCKRALIEINQNIIRTNNNE